MFSRSGTTRIAIDSFGNLNGAGSMCAPTGTTRLCDFAQYGFEHGTEDERKNLWDWQRLNNAPKKAIHTVSEAHRAFTESDPIAASDTLEGVSVMNVWRSSFLCHRTTNAIDTIDINSDKEPCDNEQRSLRDAIRLAVWPEVGLQRNS